MWVEYVEADGSCLVGVDALLDFLRGGFWSACSKLVRETLMYDRLAGWGRAVGCGILVFLDWQLYLFAERVLGSLEP